MFLAVEYEAEVPQFAVLWYLPLLSALAAFTLPLVARARGAWPATAAALVFTLVRGLASTFLAVLEHSAALVPPQLVVAVADDLARRRSLPRVPSTRPSSSTCSECFGLVRGREPERSPTSLGAREVVKTTLR